ncbi:MAG: TatD family hydrolase [Armatimonadota bacterium]
MIDTHCHLNDAKFAGEEASVMVRAKEVGVCACLVAGFDNASSQKALELARIDGVYIALGIHPHDADWTKDNPDWVTHLRNMLQTSPRVAAIGEIGLDFHYNFSHAQIQLDAFRKQIGLAIELDLPITVHSRAAEDQVMDVFEEEGMPHCGAVLHAFTGTNEQIDRAIALGLFIGVGGMVTFKKADELRETIKRAPLERILLETDAPYLAPIPLRGKRNEPANIVHVLPTLAELFQLSPQEIEERTDANARRVFSAISG